MMISYFERSVMVGSVVPSPESGCMTVTAE